MQRILGRQKSIFLLFPQILKRFGVPVRQLKIYIKYWLKMGSMLVVTAREDLHGLLMDIFLLARIARSLHSMTAILSRTIETFLRACATLLQIQILASAFVKDFIAGLLTRCTEG